MKIKAPWHPIHYSYFLLQQFHYHKEPSIRLKLMSALFPEVSKTELQAGATKFILLASLLFILMGCGNYRSQEANAPASNEQTQNQAQAENGAQQADDNIQAAAQAAPEGNPQAQVDNTAVNARDRDGNTLTPEDQSEKEPDRLLTQQIRKSLVSDDALSTAAKNVKVITVNGSVTLRGPVESEEEKRMIGQKAQQQAGSGKVNNQLEVIKPLH